MKTLTEQHAYTLVELIRKKEISVTEVVTQFVEKINSVNQKINAVVQMDVENVMEQAKEADALTLKSEKLGKIFVKSKDLFVPRELKHLQTINPLTIPLVWDV